MMSNVTNVIYSVAIVESVWPLQNKAQYLEELGNCSFSVF